MDSGYELRKRRKLGLANVWKLCLTIFVTWANTHAHTYMHICVFTHITYQSILLIVTHHYIFERGKEECGGDGQVKARAVLILVKKNPSPHPNCCLVSRLCPTLCALMDCSLPGSSVHGISQTRTLEWVGLSFLRESYQSRDRTHVSCISRWIP